MWKELISPADDQVVICENTHVLDRREDGEGYSGSISRLKKKKKSGVFFFLSLQAALAPTAPSVPYSTETQVNLKTDLSKPQQFTGRDSGEFTDNVWQQILVFC